jgi:hypothetical protein
MFQPSEQPVISSDASPARLARAAIATNDKARISQVMEHVLLQCRSSDVALPLLRFVHSVLVVLFSSSSNADMV